jgi:hypothetical protein
MGQYVTEEQIERAKEIDVLEYILNTEPQNIRRVGKEYRLKDHKSLAVSPFKWYWHSRGIGGRTAIGYLTDVRGYSFADAVCILLNETPQACSVVPKVKPNPEPKRNPFVLPLRNGDNRHVIAYLQSRGIDKELILNCINNGLLYESKGFHNAVFIGRDERGKVRYAALRGITGNFKQDIVGSSKAHGFILLPNDSQSREVAVFESPVDCLSHQTLCKRDFIPRFDGWRLSLGGTSILALKEFLKQHPEVTRCFVCTDNDEAGNNATAKIAALPGITEARSPPVYGNDWNDTLMAVQKAERIGNRAKVNKGVNHGIY